MRVTYYPVVTQRQFEVNRQWIQGKPHEKYFSGDLWLREEVLPALRVPMAPSVALAQTPYGLNSLF